MDGQFAPFQPVQFGGQSGPAAGFVAPVVSGLASSASDSTDASSFTLSMTGMITNGHRIIGVIGRGTAVRTITGMTLDGVTANQAVVANNGGSTCAIWVAASTLNTTGDLAITLDGVWVRMAAGVWNVQNLQSTTATATAADTAAPLSQTINVSAAGACFAAAYNQNTTGSDQFTWTGLTDDFDLSLEGTASAGGASSVFAAAQSPLTVSVSLASAANVAAMAVAAFR